MKILYRIVHGLMIALVTQMAVICFNEHTAIIYLAFMIGVAIERLGENKK